MECYYHKGQQLLNFCTNKECSLPLCPKCIPTHLSQTTASHRLMPFDELLQMLEEQLETAANAIKNDVELIKSSYSAENVIEQFRPCLAKYKQQAINQINQHFQLLEKQLLFELNSVHNRCLTAFIPPLQSSLQKVEEYQIMMKGKKKVQAAIRLISQNQIQTIQSLLSEVEDRKQMWKNELPRLDAVDEWKLKVIPGKSTSSYQSIQPASRDQSAREQFVRGTNLERIAFLESQLHSLRAVG